LERQLLDWSAGAPIGPFQRAVALLGKLYDQSCAEDVAELSALLRAEPGLTAADGTNGNTLVHLANGRPASIEMLLAAGADPAKANDYGTTPLHDAAGYGELETATRLLKLGVPALTDARGEGGTPLVYALFYGYTSVASLLVPLGLKPDNLRVAASLGNLRGVQRFFKPSGELDTLRANVARGFYRPHGAFPGWKTSANSQELLDEAFNYASRSGQLPVMKFLLERGAKIDADPYRGTALSWSVFLNHPEAVQALLELGANPNQRTTFGGAGHGQDITALHLTAQYGNLKIMDLLLDAGADCNVRDGLFDATPLGWAKFGKHPQAIERLRAAGATD
jgi:ankyrin repeat protein